MKKWEIIADLGIKNKKFKTEEVVEILLKNRGIKTKTEKEAFLNPKLSEISSKTVMVDRTQLNKTIKRINLAIENKEQIVIYGDYDVDGICASAILWETLNSMGAKVMPYIPHRIDQGYGLSENGIADLTSQIKYTKLIITVDNGIVANKAVDFAKKQGIDVIVTDHHVPSKKLPKAFSIVHTTLLCGTGVAYILAQKLRDSKTKYLELVALATVADLVPLIGPNRTLLKYGLLELQNTKRKGLLALFDKAKINKKTIGVYEIGHIIAPRLNAMGRIDSAMDSLRLICTTDSKRAENLADKLTTTNKQRQVLTEESSIHAKTKVRNNKEKEDRLIFIADEGYEQGVIGLIAGKLVEEFYMPSIVISKGKTFSKASARSVSGFNIIEFIREELDLLVDVGGHPMAAGFTVETKKLSLLEKKLKKRAAELLGGEMIKRSIKIDLEIPYFNINQNLYDSIQKLQPFGMKNPEPVFLTRNLIIESMRLVGKDGKHLKFNFQFPNSKFQIQAIYFGAGENSKFSIGNSVDVVYSLEANEWNGNKNLQLKIKEILVNNA